ncbi:dihydroxyacetone kinase family protein [Agrilactobacillus composti DSM 18527 = JCM 14202]|nr:dihydroxyacetone kinase family protein [Agrilactobacillus composti DSM 18527 = JCM 14202]
MIQPDSEIVTVIVGAGGSTQEAKTLTQQVGAKHSELEFEIHEGDQPVYPYLISVE